MSGPSTGRITHVAVYFDALSKGGAEMALSQVLSGLPERFRITLVGVERGSGDEIVRWVADHRPGTSYRMMAPIKDSNDFANMRIHRRMFRELDADIIHFNLSMMSSCQWPLAVALSLFDVPVLAVENSPMNTWSKTSSWLKKHTSSRLAAHVAVGERTSRIIEESAGLRAGSVETIYPGVPPVRTDVEREPSDGPIIVNVARHDPVKGVDVLLRAMALLPDDVRLVQIGGGTETEALEALRAELGLEDRVEFRGLSWDDRAADQLAGFDLFVLPSRLEGMPVTVMEAMLAGRAVVSTEVGSIREQITDGETGLIVPVEDPEALAAAIAELLADPERRAEMGARKRERAEELFTVDATVDRYVELYDAIRNQRRRSR